MIRRLRSRVTVTAAALATTMLLATPATALPASASASASAGAPAATGTSTVAPAVALELSRPTGSHGVGRDVLHLTDPDRPDPWVPEAAARELLVSVHYPARPDGGGRTAPYMATEEARLMLAARGLDGVIPAAAISSTRTHARTGTRPAPGRFPLVLLSPGFATPRATLTGLAEDLASRGYVVASVDHAYESTGTLFPDGRILTCAACQKVEEAPDLEAEEEILAGVSAGRAADLSFVADRLTGRHPAWRHSRLIDRRRIAAVGHSIGGNAAASLMNTDRRVDAGINMDGTFFEPVPASGLDGRPFMMLGTAAGHRPGSPDTSWGEGWQRLDGWKRWLTVTDSGHFTFTDIPELAGQLGVPVDPTASLSGDRSVQITRAYVAAFVDLHLRGRTQPLLAGPTPGYPEVTFEQP